jgi:ADP-ribose pyrophosphatase YjhB (NUDIX family)
MYTSGEGVNFCIVRGGAVLLQQRDEQCPHFPLRWCVPGGAKEKDESYEAAAVREIAEEYELTVSEGDLVWLTDRPENNPGKVFLVEIDQSMEPIMHEGKAMRWFPIEQLGELELGFSQSTFITPALLKHYHI